ncbi:MAG: S24 family peptidase [Saprospiraceae bacterium]
MCNIVTQRFVKCIQHLKDDNGVKSIRQFALALDYHPQNLNEIIKGNRDVTIELIRAAADEFKFNPTYVFTGEGNMFLEHEDQGTKPTSPLEKILYVPVAAHAGYAEQFQDQQFLTELTYFSLPDYKFQHGTYRCFDIAGDSMEPSLYSGDKVVCSLVDNNNFYSSVRNNLVYVVVTNGGILVKRLINHVMDKQSIELVSDNSYYAPQFLQITEIKEIWTVEVKISPYLPSPKNMRNGFYDEMESMRQVMESQASAIKTLNLTIEKLLRSSRS